MQELEKLNKEACRALGVEPKKHVDILCNANRLEQMPCEVDIDSPCEKCVYCIKAKETHFYPLLYTPNNLYKVEEVVLKNENFYCLFNLFFNHAHSNNYQYQVRINNGIANNIVAGYGKTREHALLNLVIKIAGQIKSQVKSEMFEY